MFTVVRNSVADIPTSHDSFIKGKPVAKAPRFDMMITRLKEDQRKMNASQTRFDTKARDAIIKSYFETVDNKIGRRDMTPNKYSTIRYEGPPMIDTKQFKQTFLKGQKEALYYDDPNLPKASTYQQHLKGLQIENEDFIAKILDNGRVSCAGNAMPDPAMMTHSNMKFETFEQDRLNMSRRMFQSTGMGTLSPQSRKNALGHSAKKSMW